MEMICPGSTPVISIITISYRTSHLPTSLHPSIQISLFLSCIFLLFLSSCSHSLLSLSPSFSSSPSVFYWISRCNKIISFPLSFSPPSISPSLPPSTPPSLHPSIHPSISANSFLCCHLLLFLNNGKKHTYSPSFLSLPPYRKK